MICNLFPEIAAEEHCKLTYPESTACCPRQSTDIAVACEREHTFSSASKASSGWRRQAGSHIGVFLFLRPGKSQLAGMTRCLQWMLLPPSNPHPHLTLTCHNGVVAICSPTPGLHTSNLAYSKLLRHNLRTLRESNYLGANKATKTPSTSKQNLTWDITHAHTYTPTHTPYQVTPLHPLSKGHRLHLQAKWQASGNIQTPPVLNPWS